MIPAISTSFGRSQLYRIPTELAPSTAPRFAIPAARPANVNEPTAAPKDSFRGVVLAFAAILVGVVAIVALRIGLYAAGHSEMPMFRQLLSSVGLGA